MNQISLRKAQLVQNKLLKLKKFKEQTGLRKSCLENVYEKFCLMKPKDA